MTRRYYEEEMRYLHEAAKAFADAHPEQARYLNIDSVTDRDPYVERLFEGFAFLSGRIHERLDDEMPEYTESLLQLLAPHFLKPLPAVSIVEFQTEPGLVQETTTLERGLEVRSDPVGPENVRCRFTTTQDVRLQPLRLDDVALRYHSDNTSSVQLRLGLERGATLGALDLDPLSLYFHADAPTASTMHLFWTRHVTHVTASADGGATTAVRGQEWVEAGGLSEEDGLLPYAPSTFPGSRLLQEYLWFRRKFWFVNLKGLSRLDASDDAATLEVEVFFDRPYPEERRFERENVRLHCTPVVNLFPADAEPIRVRGETYEHRVVPSVHARKGMVAYDVQTVVGIEEASGNRHEYTPFLSFDHALDGPRANGAPARYYTTSRRVGPADHPEIYLSLSDAQMQALTEIPAETLSIELRCTNGSLPREALKEGMIRHLAPDVPNIVTPRNLTQPSLIEYPPHQGEPDYFWKLISHWSFNYRSVATRDALTGLLQLYDWTGSSANRRRLRGIRRVDASPTESIQRGAVLRGTEVTVEVEDGHFADEGDLCLFGLVLSRFLAMYATLNSFVHLTIVTSPSEKRYTWTPNRGARPTL